MPIKDWEKLPDGNLVVSRITAWEGIIAPECGVLRLQTISAAPGGNGTVNSVTQLALNGEQLRDLGEGLLRLAVELKVRQNGVEQKH